MKRVRACTAGFCHPAFRNLAVLPEMLADLRFHLSQLLISSCVFSRSGGTETELADLEPVWADEEARAVLEPEPVSRHDFRHARSSRTAILREEEAGFYVRLHGGKGTSHSLRRIRQGELRKRESASWPTALALPPAASCT